MEYTGFRQKFRGKGCLEDKVIDAMERESKSRTRWHHVSPVSTEDSNMPLTSVLGAGANEESIAERLEVPGVRVRVTVRVRDQTFSSQGESDCQS